MARVARPRSGRLGCRVAPFPVLSRWWVLRDSGGIRGAAPDGGRHDSRPYGSQPSVPRLGAGSRWTPARPWPGLGHHALHITLTSGVRRGNPFAWPAGISDQGPTELAGLADRPSHSQDHEPLRSYHDSARRNRRFKSSGPAQGDVERHRRSPFSAGGAKSPVAWGRRDARLGDRGTGSPGLSDAKLRRRRLYNRGDIVRFGRSGAMCCPRRDSLPHPRR